MNEHEQYLNLERDTQMLARDIIDLNKNINHCRSSKSLMLNKLLPYLLIARQSLNDKQNQLNKQLHEMLFEQEDYCA